MKLFLIIQNDSLKMTLFFVFLFPFLLLLLFCLCSDMKSNCISVCKRRCDLQSGRKSFGVDGAYCRKRGRCVLIPSPGESGEDGDL